MVTFAVASHIPSESLYTKVTISGPGSGTWLGEKYLKVPSLLSSNIPIAGGVTTVVIKKSSSKVSGSLSLNTNEESKISPSFIRKKSSSATGQSFIGFIQIDTVAVSRLLKSPSLHMYVKASEI